MVPSSTPQYPGFSFNIQVDDLSAPKNLCMSSLHLTTVFQLQFQYSSVMTFPLLKIYAWVTFPLLQIYAWVSFTIPKKYPKISKQECIPVGCVPSAAVASVGGGGVWPEGDVWPGEGGVCLPRGASDQGGMSAQGVSAQGDVCPGGCLPQCMLRYTPPVDRILNIHFWKHYLSATTLQTVINSHIISNSTT